MQELLLLLLFLLCRSHWTLARALPSADEMPRRALGCSPRRDAIIGLEHLT